MPTTPPSPSAPYLLLIETATPVCSVALSRAGKLFDLQTAEQSNAHATALTIQIDDMMARHGLSYRDLSAVAVSKGPGSYTGLRIGVSAAKGLCYAADLPLIGIDSLYALACVLSEQASAAGEFLERQPGEELLLCPMIDARRMEVYQAVFQLGGAGRPIPMFPTTAAVIDASSFDFLEAHQRILLFGSGAGKFAELFRTNPQVRVLPGVESSAKGMVQSAYEAFTRGEFVDLAYFEPFYLKDFIPTTPKK